MFSFIQRFRYSDSAYGRPERTCLQHRRIARSAHLVDPRLAAIHRREDPHHGTASAADAGGAEGILPLGWVQPQPTAVSLKLAWGGPPREVSCIKLYPLPLSKPLHETKQKFAKLENP